LTTIIDESYDSRVYDAYNEVILEIINKVEANAKGPIRDSLRLWKGYAFYIRGLTAGNDLNYEKAVDSYEKAFELLDKEKDPITIGDIYGNLALLYKDLGDYNKALKNVRKSIDIREKANDSWGLSNSLSTLGTIFIEQEAYEDALNNYKKALEINLRDKNYSSIANNYNNIAYVYNVHLGKHEEAKTYYRKSFRLYDSLGIKRKAGTALANIGSALQEQNKIDSALYYFEKALEMKLNAGAENKTGSIYLNIASIYYTKKDYAKAIRYAEKCKEISERLQHYSDIMAIEQNLSKYYRKVGRHKDAFSSLRNYYNLKDSLVNKDNLRKAMREDERRNFLVKSIADSIAFQKDLEVSELENEKNKAELKTKEKENAILYGGIAVFVIFLGIVIYAYRRKKKDNKIISAQKEEVEQQRDEVKKQKEIIEEAHREIKDSINYAQRIQTAIMPPKKLVKEFLPGSFVLYKPKDIVAGDFYWMEHTENKILFAAADCTGHGVPGAMVSVVCNNGLNRSVREHGITEPAKILDKTREIVIAEFEKSEEEVKDGMDIALVSLEGRTLQYAGAHNPLWIIRKEATEIEEIKADKQPIGKFGAEQPFTNHIVELDPGDTIYIFSDGFADQFGGERGKKFKSGSFKKLLLSVSHESMDRQREIIDKAFEDWKGDLEQLDDVCVIGARV